MDAGQHRGLRRRSGERHPVRRVGRRRQTCLSPPALARRARASSTAPSSRAAPARPPRGSPRQSAKAQGDAFAKALGCDGKDAAGDARVPARQDGGRRAPGAAVEGRSRLLARRRQLVSERRRRQPAQGAARPLRARRASPRSRCSSARTATKARCSSPWAARSPTTRRTRPWWSRSTPERATRSSRTTRAPTTARRRRPLPRVFGDAVFVCPSRRAGARLRQGRRADVSLPLHLREPSTPRSRASERSTRSELPFVFGNPSELLPENLTAAERPLATAMMGYWGRIAAERRSRRRGRPGLPEVRRRQGPEPHARSHHLHRVGPRQGRLRLLGHPVTPR